MVIRLEMPNTSENALQGNETPIYQSVAELLTVNHMYPDIATTVRLIIDKFKADKVPTFGYRQYTDRNDLSKRGDYQYIDYATISSRIDNISV